jgi:CubicO group peptidase (beta-lactamase class C family)
MKQTLISCLAALGCAGAIWGTEVRLVNGRWHLNGEVTYRGTPAEGLLMNVRMVNATFEDRNDATHPPGFDADTNTDRFIARIPDYAAAGVRGFTLCLQGGMPGYEGAVNSAYEPDGALRPDYLRRVERVLRACDRHGVAVILGCYYQRQSAILRDEAALRAGVVNTVNWLRATGLRNVLLEVANEYPHRGFAQPLLRSPQGMAGLIRLAKATWPELLVSASGYGDGRIHPEVAEASDFLLPHFNGTPVEQIPARLDELKRFNKPVVCNEDDKTVETAAAALRACVANGASYGAMFKRRNQYLPLRFDGPEDDPVFYAALKAVTSRRAAAAPAAGPYVNGTFRGRIAYSCDGNHNDPDDWAASPVGLAILAEAGLKDRLVHFDYNSILPQNDAEFERQHAASVLGAAERYGYDRARFHDCRQQLDQAVASIARAINESSAENPLWFIIAGPMEVPYRGILQSDPAKRRFVYCVSHSRWNDGFSPRYTFSHTKRSVIELDVNWAQIRDQNRLLSLSPYNRTAKPEEFAGFFWMRDSTDPKVRFLWERMLASQRPDPSDAGMAWFVATGDEDCTPAKLRRLLEEKQRPQINPARDIIRLEAENFRHLEGFTVEDRNDRHASHRLQVALAAGAAGRIRTPFHEPFAPAGGRFDVDVRYHDTTGGQARFTLLINGVAPTDGWKSPGRTNGWTTHTVRGVTLQQGDEMEVRAQGAGARLDYVQLNLVTNAPGATGGPDGANYFPPPETEGGWRALVRVNETPTAAQKADIRARAGLDWDRLAEAQRFCAGFGGNQSFLVIRHGWIAAEWNDLAAPRGIASCTKSLTALAMARLFDLSDAGQLPRRIAITDEAWRFLPAAWAEAEPARKRIQLRHLLTMTSGLTPYDGPYREQYETLIHAQTVEAPPGTVWAYASVPVDLLSLVIENVTGRTQEEFFHAEIGSRIGGARMQWGRFGDHTGGSGGPQGGARFTARELARVGWLVLHDGVWERDGRREQVISAARLREFTRQADWLLACQWRQPNFAREPHGHQTYSHLWWNNRTGQTLGEAVPRDAIYMSGFGKQICALIPSLDLIVARLGANRALNDRSDYYHELFARIMAAVVR